MPIAKKSFVAEKNAFCISSAQISDVFTLLKKNTKPQPNLKKIKSESRFQKSEALFYPLPTFLTNYKFAIAFERDLEYNVIV